MSKIKLNFEFESDNNKRKTKPSWIYFLMGILAVIGLNHHSAILSFLEYLCKL